MSVTSYQHPELGFLKVILEQDGKVWFCLSDLCNALSCPYAVQLAFSLKKEDVAMLPVAPDSGRKMNFVTFEGTARVFELLRDKGYGANRIEKSEAWVEEIFVALGGTKEKPEEVVNVSFNEVFSAMSHKAEMAVLGTILVHPEFYPFSTLGNIYGQRIFLCEFHKKIHRCIAELNYYLDMVSPELFLEFARTKGVLSEVGGEEYIMKLKTCAVHDKESFFKSYSLLVSNLAYGMYQVCENYLLACLDSATGVSGVFEALNHAEENLTSINKEILRYEHVINALRELTQEQKAAILKGWPKEMLQKCYNRTAVELAVQKGESPGVEGFMPFKRSE